MKSLFAYCLAIILPMFALSVGARLDYLHASGFTTLLLFYALIYHPLVSGLRLLKANKIDRKILGFVYSLLEHRALFETCTISVFQ
jgi:hypothetical protein